MENYIISFPKHFHYCNKGSVCFADTLATESMQKASEVSCAEEIQSACLHNRTFCSERWHFQNPVPIAISRVTVALMWALAALNLPLDIS